MNYYIIKIHNIQIRVPSKEYYEERKDFYDKLVTQVCNTALNYR